MTNFRPMKPREPGSIWDAISTAMDQVGGPEKMANAVQRKPYWAYVVSDDAQSAKQRTSLSFADACTIADKGGHELAQHLALCAGGVFLPIGDARLADVQTGAALLSQEAGEAVSGLIQRMMDGSFDGADRRASLPQLLDVLGVIAPLIALCREEQPSASNVTTLKREA